MLVSLNWVRDFVDLGSISNKEITDLMTIRTAELDGIHQWGTVLDSAIVVEVVSTEILPSQKASKVVLNAGLSAPVTVVCAAKNVRVGMKSVLAPVGSVLPDGRAVEAKELYGMVSYGFLCSESELGLGADNAGIVELDSSASAGMKASSVFPDAVDTVIEIDNKSLTHRPDLWCHYGFAREIATIFNVPLKNPFTDEWRKKVLAKTVEQEPPVTPVVSPESSCLGYVCVSVDNVTIAQSPARMRHRLNRVGIRAINTAVDIGNYVMLELGLPLHMFDRDLIQGSHVQIGPMQRSEKMELLDGVQVELLAGDTVVSDSAGPLVIGGVKGGKRTGVSPGTTRLLIETANWAASAVRKLSLRIGVRTDSSLRYEKSLDSQLLVRNAIRALELVLEFSPGAKIAGNIATAHLPLAEPKKILLSITHAREILGADVPEAEFSRILTGLGFGISAAGDRLEVTVPSYRATKDVTCDMDLIEEIGRMYGYENIPPTSPEFKVLPVRLPAMKRLQRSISDFMAFGARALEVMTYPMVGQELLQKVQWPELNEKLMLKNALSVEADRMRPSIIPTALQALVLNQKNYPSFRFFEFGRTYRSAESFCQEREELLIASFDKSERTIVKTMEIVEQVLSLTHRGGAVFAPLTEKAKDFVSPEWPGLMPTVNFQIEDAGEILGAVFEVSPELLRSLKVRGHFTLAVISMPALVKTALFDPRMFQPINYFPATSLDVTVVADERRNVGDILASVRETDIEGLQNISIVSVFPLDGHKKAVTLRAALQKATGTLSPEEMKSCEQQIIGTLGSAGFPMRS